MPRIAGVDIPDNKPILYALQYIHGVGGFVAERVLREAGIEPTVRANTLNEDQLAQLANIIDASHIVEGALRRQTSQNIQRLRDTRSYRGSRHHRGLPVRGQRTKTNARTRKGRKKTVAGKKSVKGMR